MLYKDNFIFKKYGILWTSLSCKIHLQNKKQLFSYLTLVFLQKVFGPILRLPETLLTFCISGHNSGSCQTCFVPYIRQILGKFMKISDNSQVHFRIIQSMSRANIKHFSSFCQVYLRYKSEISIISQACLNKFQSDIRKILSKSQAYLRHNSGSSQAYIRSI